MDVEPTRAPAHNWDATQATAAPIPTRSPEVTAAPQVASESAGAESTALQVLHRTLRGRYPVVVALGLLLAGAGGLAGWRFPKPLYRSEALVRIRWQSADADPTPFDVFMQSQQTLITSRRVVDKALLTPEWHALRQPITPQVIAAFATDLAVEIKPRTEYLKITYTDPDPFLAYSAVRAVTSAYVDIYGSDEQQSKATLLRAWKKERQERADRVATTEAQIEHVVKEFGSADLASLHDAAMQRTARLDSALDELRVAMTAATNAGPATQPAEQLAAQSAPATEQAATPRPQQPLTPDQIAKTDSLMRGYLDEQRRVEDQLEDLRLRGFLDSHSDVVRAKNALRKAKDRVGSYAAEYHVVKQVTGRGPGEMDAAAALALKSPTELQAQEPKLIALRDKASQEMVRLETARLHVDQIQARLRKDREELDGLDRKIATLQEQDQMGGRLTVINAGEIPLAPMRDLRLKLSAAGAVGGACLPIGLFALLGLVRRRYRYADETTADISRRAPLLGILPALQGAPGEPGWNPEEAAGAAQRVHQIRVMLQVGRPAQQSASYLITSASAGEGKTSLAMALGLSFAASGLRTLVIDGDLVGRELTRGMEAGELPGLYEALRSGSLRGCLRRTTAGLCVLPVGHADALDACAVSSAAVRNVLDEARRFFDTILVDTGPILGSVEASLLAQDVDGVLLTVSRGQQPPLVNRALRHLNSLGASVCGFVFNRARANDYYSSGYESSSRRASRSQRPTQSALVQRRCRFGPLVGAVVCSLPVGEEPSLS